MGTPRYLAWSDDRSVRWASNEGKCRLATYSSVKAIQTDRVSSDGEGSDGEGSDGESSDGEGSDGEGSDGEGSDGEGSDRESSDRESSDSNSLGFTKRVTSFYSIQ